jgi:hypothetical protein
LGAVWPGYCDLSGGTKKMVRQFPQKDYSFMGKKASWHAFAYLATSAR